MNRQTFWLLFGALALAVLAAAWFFAHYDRVPTTRWERPGREALRDPHLALDRFVARMGRPLARISRAQDLERLASGGALLLDRNRRLYLNARRADALLRWVENGGYLIVAAEPATVDDPVLKPLGVKWCEAPARNAPAGEPETDGSETGKDGQRGPESGKPYLGPVGIEVRVPGAARPLRLGLAPRSRNFGLQATTPRPSWRAGAEGTPSPLLHYTHGRGQVTVLADFDFLTNRRIGEYDHAELVWTLIGHYQPQGELRLATRLEVPSLWQWLGESAWMVLVSGGVLITAWLWAIVPRFGGILPAPDRPRRSLAEHLAAVGRAVWREGGLDHWSNLVSMDFREALVRRHPHLAGLAPRAQVDFLAAASGISAERIQDLFDPGAETSKEAYTDRVRTAQQLLKYN